MKRMIIVLSVLILALPFTVLAQKARVGLSGGISLAKITGKTDGEDFNTEYKSGLMGGMILDVPLNKRVSFQPGVYYIQKGWTDKRPYPGLIEKSYTALRYAETQLNFVYNASGKNNIYVGAGPSVSFNLPSKSVTEIDGVKSETSITFGKLIANDLKGIDYGANFLAGFRFSSGVFITVNYNMGIRDLTPIKTDGFKINSSYIGIQLGYLFPSPAGK